MVSAINSRTDVINTALLKGEEFIRKVSNATAFSTAIAEGTSKTGENTQQMKVYKS